MAEIDAKLVGRLRTETEAGMMDCKKALTDAGGDYEKAKKLIAERGQKKADKTAGKEATVGCIGSYVHDGKVGALVELACNTDFVAKNAEFQALIREIAIAVVAYPKPYVYKEQVPAELVAEERKKYENDVKGKPPEIAAKILDGKMDKNLYSQLCLMHVPYPKEDEFKGSYGDFVKSKIAKLGENVVVRRVHRMELGG